VGGGEARCGRPLFCDAGLTSTGGYGAGGVLLYSGGYKGLSLDGQQIGRLWGPLRNSAMAAATRIKVSVWQQGRTERHHKADGGGQGSGGWGQG
jgi:hypothetical protein